MGCILPIQSDSTANLRPAFVLASLWLSMPGRNYGLCPCYMPFDHTPDGVKFTQDARKPPPSGCAGTKTPRHQGPGNARFVRYPLRIPFGCPSDYHASATLAVGRLVHGRRLVRKTTRRVIAVGAEQQSNWLNPFKISSFRMGRAGNRARGHGPNSRRRGHRGCANSYYEKTTLTPTSLSPFPKGCQMGYSPHRTERLSFTCGG